MGIFFFFFYKLNARPSTRKTLPLTLLQWSGTKPAKAPKYVCKAHRPFNQSSRLRTQLPQLEPPCLLKWVWGYIKLSNEKNRTKGLWNVIAVVTYSVLPTWHLPKPSTSYDLDLSFKISMKQSLKSSFSDNWLSSGSFCRPCLRVTQLKFTNTESFWFLNFSSHRRPTACAFWHTQDQHYKRAFPWVAGMGFSPVWLQ